MSVWFGLDHRCEDGSPGHVHWKRDADGKDISPRRWMVCDDCGYSIRFVTVPPELAGVCRRDPDCHGVDGHDGSCEIVAEVGQ